MKTKARLSDISIFCPEIFHLLLYSLLRNHQTLYPSWFFNSFTLLRIIQRSCGSFKIIRTPSTKSIPEIAKKIIVSTKAFQFNFHSFIIYRQTKVLRDSLTRGEITPARRISIKHFHGRATFRSKILPCPRE